MKRVFVVVLLFVLVSAAGYFTFSRKAVESPAPSTPSAVEQTFDVLTGIGALKTKQEVADPQLAVIRAKAVFQKLQAEDLDFSRGPCIAEDLMPDWVADVAHNPRQPLDNKPENQCQNFRDGAAHHFVELDVSGEVIRVQ